MLDSLKVRLYPNKELKLTDFSLVQNFVIAANSKTIY